MFGPHHLVDEEFVSIDSVTVGSALIRIITGHFSSSFTVAVPLSRWVIAPFLFFRRALIKLLSLSAFSAVEMSLKAIWTCHPQERVDIDLP